MRLSLAEDMETCAERLSIPVQVSDDSIDTPELKYRLKKFSMSTLIFISGRARVSSKSLIFLFTPDTSESVRRMRKIIRITTAASANFTCEAPPI